MDSEKYTPTMASFYKKKKTQMKPVRIRFGEWGSRLPQIHCHWIFGGGLPSQIFAFSHRKSIINKRATLKNMKKIRNGNMLVEAKSWRQAEGGILKMKIFRTIKFWAYPHEKLNTSKGVIRSRELALATEEMSATLGKQGVTNIKRIIIRRGEEKVETNTYILTFNQPNRNSCRWRI